MTKGFKKWTRTAALIMAVILAVAGFAGCSQGGSVGKTVLTVNGERVSDAECNYYYVYYLTQNGIDITTQEGVSMLNSSTGLEEFPTFDDYFRYMVAREIQKTVLCLNEAKVQGWQLPSEKGKQEADSAMTQMLKECEDAGVTLDDYIKKMFGSDITQQDIRMVFERMYTAKDYYTTVLEPQWIPSEEEVITWYNGNAQDFDKVDFRSLFLPYKEGDTAANAQTLAKGQEMLGKLTTEESFISLAKEYVPAGNEEAAADRDATLNQNALKQTLNEAPAAWLFEAGRKNGDKTVVEDSKGVYVLYFLNRRKAEEPLATVRQISVLSKDVGDMQIAKAKADALLDKFTTEEEFVKLVAENSSLSEEKENGGLYENVYMGGQPQPMEDWCFDSARKAGDKAVIESEYGAHVFYFVKRTEDAEWHNRSYNALYTHKMEAAMNSLREKYPYSFS